MGTYRPKPAIAAWIARERHRLGMKPADLVTRLNAMGVQVSEQTIRVWESNADRKPSAYNLENLERIFGSQAPVERHAANGDTAAAIDRQTDVLRLLVEETQKARVAQETTAQAVAEMVGRLDRFLDLAGTPDGPVPVNGGGSR